MEDQILPPTSEDKAQTAKETAGGLVLLIVVVIGFWVWWVGGLEKAVVSLKYGVNPGNISVENRPHDCDFMQAPIGEKSCHYDPVVTGYSSDGQSIIVEGKRASYEYQNIAVTRIIISWRQVTD